MPSGGGGMGQGASAVCQTIVIPERYQEAVLFGIVSVLFILLAMVQAVNLFAKVRVISRRLMDGWRGFSVFFDLLGEPFVLLSCLVASICGAVNLIYSLTDGFIDEYHNEENYEWTMIWAAWFSWASAIHCMCFFIVFRKFESSALKLAAFGSWLLLFFVYMALFAFTEYLEWHHGYLFATLTTVITLGMTLGMVAVFTVAAVRVLDGPSRSRFLPILGTLVVMMAFSLYIWINTLIERFKNPDLGNADMYQRAFFYVLLHVLSLGMITSTLRERGALRTANKFSPMRVIMAALTGQVKVIGFILFSALLLLLLFLWGVHGTCAAGLTDNMYFGWSLLLSRGTAKILMLLTPVTLFLISRPAITLAASFGLWRFLPLDSFIDMHWYCGVGVFIAGVLHSIGHTGTIIQAYIMGWEEMFGITATTYWLPAGVTGVILMICMTIMVVSGWKLKLNQDVPVWVHRLTGLLFIVMYLVHGARQVLAENLGGQLLVFSVVLYLLFDIVYYFATTARTCNWEIQRFGHSAKSPCTVIRLRLNICDPIWRRNWRKAAGDYALLGSWKLAFMQTRPFTVGASSEADGIVTLTFYIRVGDNPRYSLSKAIEEHDSMAQIVCCEEATFPGVALVERSPISVGGPFVSPAGEGVSIAQRSRSYKHFVLSGSGVGVTVITGLLQQLYALPLPHRSMDVLILWSVRESDFMLDVLDLIRSWPVPPEINLRVRFFCSSKLPEGVTLDSLQLPSNFEILFSRITFNAALVASEMTDFAPPECDVEADPALQTPIIGWLPDSVQAVLPCVQAIPHYQPAARPRSERTKPAELDLFALDDVHGKQSSLDSSADFSSLHSSSSLASVRSRIITDHRIHVFFCGNSNIRETFANSMDMFNRTQRTVNDVLYWKFQFHPEHF